MGTVGVIWGAFDSLIYISNNSPCSKAPLNNFGVLGAFLKSRSCLKYHHNLGKSMKIAWVSICAAPFDMLRDQMIFLLFLGLIWSRRLSTTSLGLHKPNLDLRRLSKLHDTSKNLQKYSFLPIIDSFSLCDESKGAFHSQTICRGAEAPLVLYEASAQSRGASLPVKVAWKRQAPFESQNIALKSA